MTARIEIRNLWKEYGEQVVLEHINLSVAAGDFCTIVGASGCGKTTFLRLLLGEESPSRGEILLDGEPLTAEPGPDRGIVFQRYSVFPHLSALRNVMLGLELRGAPLTGRLFGAKRRRARDEAAAMLEAVGLGHALEKYPDALSGGMQQRLALAQSLVMHPRILLLDEPFGALDPGIRADMHQLVGRLWRENDLTVFMITHDLKEGFHLGTRLLVFDKLRHDPDAPRAYGAGVTYDLPVARADQRTLERIEADVNRSEALAPQSAEAEQASETRPAAQPTAGADAGAGARKGATTP
jgi:NitT/TauT family transport system ATP-binding protein